MSTACPVLRDSYTLKMTAVAESIFKQAPLPLCAPRVFKFLCIASPKQTDTLWRVEPEVGLETATGEGERQRPPWGRAPAAALNCWSPACALRSRDALGA